MRRFVRRRVPRSRMQAFRCTVCLSMRSRLLAVRCVVVSPRYSEELNRDSALAEKFRADSLLRFDHLPAPRRRIAVSSRVMPYGRSILIAALLLASGSALAGPPGGRG